MSKKKLGRETMKGYPFRMTFAQNDSTQAILLKLDEVIAKLNLLQITGELSFESEESAGGAATEVLTVPGVLATDSYVSATITQQGENTTTIVSASISANNAVSVTFAADPGAGAVVSVTVSRAEDTKIELIDLVL